MNLAKIRQIVGWIFISLLVLFIVLNLDEVQVRVLPGFEVRMPRAFVIFFSAALGAGAVFALQYFRKIKKPPT